MFQLWQRLKPLGHDATIVQDIAKLASTEREVRTLEMLIQHISSLDDEDLARVWPRLIAAIYHQKPPSLLESSSRRMDIHPQQ